MAKVHGKRTQIYMNGQDISTFFNQVDTTVTVDIAEDSGFNATDKTYKVGMKSCTKRLQGHWDDREEDDSIAFLLEQQQQKDGGEAPIVTIVYVPEQNGRAHSGVADLISNLGQSAPIAGIVGLTADFQCSDGMHSVRNVMEKGTIDGEQSATDEFHNGTATIHGITGHLHVFDVIGGTPAISIEHSPDGTSDWSSIVNFAATDEVTAETVEVSGTVEPFLRATVSGGTAVAWVGAYQPPA